MTAYVRETREVRQTEDSGVQPVTTDESWMAQFTATNIVWYIAGLLEALLALRFVLALLGANPANAFASLIYGISYPFVAPFFSLFSYDVRYNVAHLEVYTLVAMIVYAIIAYGIARLITINRPATNAY